MIDEKILEEDWKDAKELSKRMSEEYRLSMPSSELFALCLIYISVTKLRILQKKHHDLEHKFQKKFNKK